MQTLLNKNDGLNLHAVLEVAGRLWIGVFNHTWHRSSGLSLNSRQDLNLAEQLPLASAFPYLLQELLLSLRSQEICLSYAPSGV